MILKYIKASLVLFFTCTLVLSCSSYETNCNSNDATCNSFILYLLSYNFTKTPVWISRSNTKVMYSLDDGLTWSISTSSFNSLLRNISSNKRKRWVLSGASEFYYSDDDGKNWTKSNNSGGLSGIIYALSFFDDRWWAGDSLGNLASSKNGIDWTFVKSFPGQVIEAIGGYNNTLMLVGDVGFNAYSSDYINWVVNTPIAGADLFGLVFNASGQVTVVGPDNPPAAFISSNFGVTWQNAASTGQDFSEVTIVENTYFTNSTSNLNLYSSTDSLNFTALTPGFTQSMWSIDSLQKTLILVGNFGEIWRSADAGQTWKKITSPLSTALFKVRAENVFIDTKLQTTSNEHN